MKYTFAFAILAIISIGIASCSNETTTSDISATPVAVQNTVKDNFSSNVIAVTTETNTFGEDEYEVVLADGTKVEFLGDEWKEVSVPAGQNVPVTFVIEPIQTYVATNNPGQSIVKIERKDKKGYEIKLSNGVEIVFDSNGNFVKID